MAQIGKEKIYSFDELNRIVKKIIVAARRLASYWSKQYFRNEQEEKKHYESIRKNEDIIWDTFSEDDLINTELNKVIEDIENICQDVIFAKGTLHGLLNTDFHKAFNRHQFHI